MSAGRHELVHARTIAAPPSAVYDLVAEVSRWPVVFGPTVHVQPIEQARDHERFQLWAVLNGEVQTWTSRRRLDPGARCIEFEQERSQPPVASMGGAWRFRPVGSDRTEVVLEHHFAAVDDDPGARAWIRAAVDANSEAELAALDAVAGTGEAVEDVVVSFTDDVIVDGPAGDLYEFIRRAERWPDRLPHVGAVDLREEVHPEGVTIQDLSMDTVTRDGSSHRTRSTRLCLSGDRIVYKQTVLPRALLGHAGEWRVEPGGPGGVTRVVARHLVAIDAEGARRHLGHASLAESRAYLRDALGANSRATIEGARAFVAGRRSGTRTART